VARYGARRTSSGSDGDLSLSGETFTVEAMEIAKTEGREVVAVHEFFRTDAGDAAIRQIIQRDRKRQWPLGSLSI
jgi:hypothetical protein